ncbi:hypothetical protein BpHYR1_013577 [Brachionus plicatilis]|uniref:Uncharacterized protein n=1 Tax=Brachionus plicatilis TaxID=10195 RepID=A0A3M7QAY3_BRAPC|nr:hypothetical protein BpHYR1_013577 [Brachionus plicatilis]
MNVFNVTLYIKRLLTNKSYFYRIIMHINLKSIDLFLQAYNNISDNLYCAKLSRSVCCHAHYDKNLKTKKKYKIKKLIFNIINSNKELISRAKITMSKINFFKLKYEIWFSLE